MSIRLNQKFLPLIATTAVCAAIYFVASLAYPHFFGWDTLVHTVASKSELGIIAVGMTFVILSGGIDLSVGSVFALSTMVVASLVVKLHWHPLAAMAAAIGVGAAVGLLTGCLVQFFNLPAFLVTLAMLFLARGAALVMNHQKPIELEGAGFFASPDPNATTYTGLGVHVFGTNVPFRALVFVGVIVVAAVAARATRFGRNLYALGGNEHAAGLMGLPVGRTKVLVYTLSGILSALAGLVMLSDVSSGDPMIGLGWELDAIAAVVIGGTLLTGGVGYVAGTLLGVLILALIEQIINFDGRLDASWARVVNGLLLFAFIALQKLLTHVRPGRRPPAFLSSLLRSAGRKASRGTMTG